MKSSIWNYRCPSIACHLWFNACFSVKINTFSTHDLLVREFRSFLEPKICLRSCWLLDNCLFFGGISIFRLRQALQPLFLWQKNPKMMEYIFFSPFPRPSLNNDSLGPWGFAPYFHSGATFYPCSYLPLVFYLEPFISFGTWIFLWGYCQRSMQHHPQTGTDNLVMSHKPCYSYSSWYRSESTKRISLRKHNSK